MNIKNYKFFGNRENEKNRNVFIKAYDEQADAIYRFIYFKIGKREEAQDLASAVFLKTWDYIQQNQIKQRTLRALIYKIARNTIVDYYRDQGNSRIDNINGNFRNDLIDEKQNIMGRIEQTSDLLMLEKNFMKLKDEYREIITLRFIEDLSIGEIAEILEKTRGNVRVLIYRALKSLKDIVDQNNNL